MFVLPMDNFLSFKDKGINDPLTHITKLSLLGGVFDSSELGVCLVVDIVECYNFYAF